MPPQRQHPAKGWAGTLDRTSMIRTDINQDSHYNQDRINREGALLRELKIKPGYVFTEPGKSASKTTIERRELERAVNAIVRDKAIEALIVPTVDRLSRLGMRHVGEKLDAVEAVGGRIIFIKENLDSSQPRDRVIIAFLAEQARVEASNLSWRIETWHDGCRLKGKWVGKRPYGYEVIEGKLAPHPDEAPIVRWVVDEFLSGQPILKISTMLNEKGVLAPDASKAAGMIARGRKPNRQTISTWWNTTSVRRVLLNPALVGWRKHKNRVALDPEGEPISFGEGILAPGKHARVLAEFERRSATVRNSPTGARAVGAKTGGGRPARYLLPGIGRCRSCNYALGGRPRNGDKRRGPNYQCSGLYHGYPCPAPAAILAEAADAEVIRQVRIRLAAMEPGDPVLDAIAERWRERFLPEEEGERSVLQLHLDAIRGRIVDLDEARYMRGEFTSADDTARWERMMERLKLQRDAVQLELDDLGPPPDFDLNSLRGHFDPDVWKATPLPQRRILLQIAVDKVLLGPAHKRRVPPADRVEVIMAGSNPAEVGQQHT